MLLVKLATILFISDRVVMADLIGILVAFML